jgi:outer membrane protein
VTCLVVALLLAGSAATEEPLLSLDEAVRIARTSHPKVDAARAQLEAARAVLSQATAGFLPGVTGEIAYQPQTANSLPPPGLKRLLSHLTLPGTASVADSAGDTITTVCLQSSACAPAPAFSLPPASYDLQTFWTAGLGMFWNLWDWGTTIYGQRAARSNVEAQRYGVVAQQNDVALNTKLAFFNLLAVLAAVKVAEQAVATEQLNVETAKQMKKAGVSAEVDVATALADLAKAQLSLVLVQGAISSAQAALALAMGQPSWRGYTLQPPPEPPEEPTPSEASAIDQAQRDRPEPRELALQARGYHEAAKAARGQFLPQLVIQGGAAWTGDSLASVTNFGLSVSLSYPLTGLNPFLVRAQMRQAEADRGLTLAQERQTRDEVGYQVADAISAVSTARQALIAVKQYLDAGHARYELARKSYAAGVVDIVQLSEATLQYIDAQFRQVTAMLNLNQARARLEWALGRP